ncbi:hypothetical protein ACRALDRAFT_2024992 [Sodiomyces alcalophilus JCM 7366]|uniref:uncharacterized protein n=1 Tax=Sodiomyces alcalophilus JCM 7366 TaxID=591952 RepID=UPI0039B63293
MALRYSPEFLLYLRDSPLCTKPANLPPAEEWMGPPPETVRTPSKATSDRRHNDSLSGDQSRRPGQDRFLSRNGPNPDDIILGPPRTAFASTGAGARIASFDYDKESKDFDSRDRFNFRNRNGDVEGSRNHGFRRRGDADQDGEGWSTVKPRKSFGSEGAERFHGRMGGNDRFNNNDRKLRDRADHDPSRDRPRRALDNNYAKDGDEGGDTRSRSSFNRGRAEPWFKSEGDSRPDKHDKHDKPERPAMTTRERIDRAKSWRDRDKDAETFEDRDRDRDRDRHMGRNHDRRWDRDHRNEREPEWFDEPAGDKPGGHTEEDFRRFMESMKAGKNKPAAAQEKPAASAPAEATTPPKPEQPAPASAAAVESGPDKFFMAFASNTGLDGTNSAAESPKDATPKPARSGVGKSSRFTSFFSAPQEDPNRRPQPEPGHANATTSAVANAAAPPPISQAPDAEKEAFQVLLQKLQLSQPQARSSPPAVQAFQEPQALSSISPGQEATPASAVRSPGPFPQFPPPEHHHHHHEDLRSRQPQTQPGRQDIAAPPPLMPSQPLSSSARQDQLLQDLANQRQHASSQGSSRTEMKPNRNLSNAEFLMNLMRAQPEPMRTEQMLLRMHQQQQPQRAGSMSQMPDREPDFSSGGRISQPRQMRGQPPPPGFMDEPFHHPEHEGRPQPTQILQRPHPPPGLDPMNPNWMQPGGGGPLPPAQQRTMGPPPGLSGGPGVPGGPNRNHPLPGMFPPGPNFPPGGFPPPETIGVPAPPRGMQPPPGFYGGLPPPGFMGPPGIGGGPAFGGPGPEGHGFPFDGRGMPPPGAAQAFRRQ